MLTDPQWMRLEPLIEACRPKGKTPPQDLRRRGLTRPLTVVLRSWSALTLARMS
jgi:hypothetical protein